MGVHGGDGMSIDRVEWHGYSTAIISMEHSFRIKCRFPLPLHGQTEGRKREGERQGENDRNE